MDRCPCCGMSVTKPFTERVYTPLRSRTDTTYELGACSQACHEKLKSFDFQLDDAVLVGWTRMCRGVNTTIGWLKQIDVQRETIVAHSSRTLMGVQSMAYALQALHDKKVRDAKNTNIRDAKTRKAVENMANAIGRGSLDVHLKSLVEVILDRAENAAIEGDTSLVTLVVDTFETWVKDRRAEEW